MTGTGQRVSNIGDISEVNYTLDAREEITMKLRREHTNSIVALSLVSVARHCCAKRGGAVAGEGLVLITPPASTKESRSQDNNKCITTAVELYRTTSLITRR